MADPKITTRVERLQQQKDRAAVAAGIGDKERVLTKLRDLLDNAQGVPAEQVMLRDAQVDTNGKLLPIT